MGVPDRLSGILDTQVMRIKDLNTDECAQLVLAVVAKLKGHLGTLPGIERLQDLTDRIEGAAASLTISDVLRDEQEGTLVARWNTKGRFVFLVTLKRSDSSNKYSVDHLLLSEDGVPVLWRYSYRKQKIPLRTLKRDYRSEFEIATEANLSKIMTSDRAEALLNSLEDKLGDMAVRAEARAKGIRALEEDISRINRRLDVQLRLT